jgi:hypothetical protein
MAFVEIIRRLWKHKVLVLGVFLVAVFAAIFSAYRITSGGLEKRALSVAAASGQILVDNAERPNSTKGIEAGEFEALETRAKIYAQYLAGYDAKLEIAKEAGISPKTLATTGPFSGGPNGEIYHSQGSTERTAELLGEGSGNHANFIAQEDVPIITVQTQSADTDTAVAIASASYDVLNRYIESLHDGTRPVTDSVVVRQLGTPEGGEVGGNNNVMLMVLAFIVVFGLGCAAILIAPTFIERWHALSDAEWDEARHQQDRNHPRDRHQGDDLVVPPYATSPRHPHESELPPAFLSDGTGETGSFGSVTAERTPG